MSNEFYTGDVGVKLILTVGVDVSTATTLSIAYKKPCGDAGLWGASLETGNLSISHIFDAGELNDAGTWQVQAYVTMPAGIFYGTVANMEVYGHLYPS